MDSALFSVMPASSVCSSVKTMLRAMRVGYLNCMGSLFIVSSSTNSFLLFLLLHCRGGSRRLVMKAVAHPLLDLLFLKSGDESAWGEKTVINIVRCFYHRKLLCCMVLCEMVPSEHGKVCSCQLCMFFLKHISSRETRG